MTSELDLPGARPGRSDAAVAATGAPSSADAPGTDSYPPFLAFLPRTLLETPRYVCRFAQTRADLDAIQRLRYEVFNLELREGLVESHLIGRDRDDFDLQCHHLMTIDRESNAIVGTYRLQVAEAARAAEGFYSATEFDLSLLPGEVVEQSVEIGRACIARDHRNTRVLHLLWQGLLVYIRHNRKRYLFGCSSVTTQDPAEGARVLERLRHEGYVHPYFQVTPRPHCACVDDGMSRAGWETAHIPILFSTYLRHGARICGLPAIDRAFGTVDFFTLIDVSGVDTANFEADRRARGGRGEAAGPQ